MVEKVKLKEQKLNNLEFFSSGSTILDLALGGGWPLGRVFNIVGDKSTGKTLLAIEAFANFKRVFPKGRMRYAEAEAAFDEGYAAILGFPSDVEKPEEPLETIEQFHYDLDEFTEKEGPSLYILDSLDALSDDAEVELFEKNRKAYEEGKEQKASYGANKPKKLSGLFRQLVQDIAKRDCSLGIISQIRDNIGVSFGETKTRSGGRALDFYASQVLWLAHLGTDTRTVRKNTLPIGVKILGKVKKNKVGTPLREAEFGITFGYGIDDEISMLNYLKDQGFSKETYDDLKKKVETARNNQDYPALDELNRILKTEVTCIWKEIEADLAPVLRKYR